MRMLVNQNYLPQLISFILVSIIPVFLAYFVIRLAIRDGIKEAIKQLKKDNVL